MDSVTTSLIPASPTVRNSKEKRIGWLTMDNYIDLLSFQTSTALTLQSEPLRGFTEYAQQ